MDEIAKQLVWVAAVIARRRWGIAHPTSKEPFPHSAAIDALYTALGCPPYPRGAF